MSDDPQYDPCWLPPSALLPLGRRRVAVIGGDDRNSAPGTYLLDTVRSEVRAARDVGGGTLTSVVTGSTEVVFVTPDRLDAVNVDLGSLGDPALGAVNEIGPDGFAVLRGDGRTVVTGSPRGLLYGLYHLVRMGKDAFTGDETQTYQPSAPIRLLDHWDNMTDGPMGVVERGYAGESLFFADGAVRSDLTRVAAYARLLASIGVNAVALNNVNVHATEATLLTTHLPDVARVAEVFRRYGIAVFLSVDFAAPITLGGLASADPHNDRVQDWWAETAEAVYHTIPDFGGYVVKADSEGRPGPFAYGRDHADGANLLARALAPYGGTVFWRAFVYNHRQDWRDRSTDRARAACDHFVPLDGGFDENVIVQVKHGPLDFQIREPVSPLLGAMPATNMAVELQVTQEYTGHQLHVCYLAPLWSSVLGFPFEDAPVGDIVSGRGRGHGGVAGVSNAGTDPLWTGHPLAQVNLYAFGRLAWNPRLGPDDVLAEWARLTYGDDAVTSVVNDIVGGSGDVYEMYTAPLGVGFMVVPGHHYGPSPDGYEYSPWGTYHFADRDGIGVDRSVATGTGFAGQYPPPWRDVYESPGTCPDELLLFFHHVPYGHRLRSGSTVIQHIYDTHFEGVERVERMAEQWREVKGRVSDAVHERVAERLDEQLRSARDWRDTINTYFFRKSGVPDEHGRTIH